MPQYRTCFPMDSYDLVVIGSGPAGQKAAIAASKKVAALDAVNKMRAIANITQTGIYHPLPA